MFIPSAMYLKEEEGGTESVVTALSFLSLCSNFFKLQRLGIGWRGVETALLQLRCTPSIDHSWQSESSRSPGGTAGHFCTICDGLLHAVELSRSIRSHIAYKVWNIHCPHTQLASPSPRCSLQNLKWPCP